MTHAPFEHETAHEIRPKWIDGSPVFCMTCDMILSDAEVDAINRDREVHAANLRLLEGDGPAEREAEDENSRMN